MCLGRQSRCCAHKSLRAGRSCARITQLAAAAKHDSKYDFGDIVSMVSHTVASCFCFYGPERYKIKSDSLKISRTLGLKWDCTYNRRHAVKIYIFILHYISIHWKCIHEILTYFEKNLKYSKMLQGWMTICNLLSPNMGFAKDCSDGHNNFIIILVHPSSARPTAQRLVLNIILHKSRRTRRLLTFSESQNFLLRAHNVAI